MTKFVQNVKKYWNYLIHASHAELKSEVANSYLNWLWWLLDPICFMLVYMFIVEIVFKTKTENLPIFVFVGLTVWSFFNKNVSGSVKLVSANKGLITKAYIPKYILILEKLFVNFFKMMISWALVFVLMLVFQVPYTWQLLHFVPLLALLFVVTFSVCTILLHFGVFVEDLSNVTTIVLKLMFYLSGIFYSVSTRVPAPYNSFLLNLNPAAFLIDSFRNIIMYNQAPNYLMVGIWFVIAIVISIVGIKIIEKYENSYVKVLR